MRFPVHVAGRGGQYTYHGPGQRVVYAMLDLRARRQDVRRFVSDLEEWTIRTLARFSVTAERRAGRVGVWVVRPDKPPARRQPREDKIAAIGVRIRHWVSFHGISINVEPDLSHYAGIVPCGIAEHGVTSLVDLGLPVTMTDLDTALAETFDEVFGRNGAVAASVRPPASPDARMVARISRRGSRSPEARFESVNRRKLRKALRQDVEIDRLDVDVVDAGHGRAAAAGVDHLADRLVVADDQRLDRAVDAVAHPAGEAEALRRSSSPSRDSRRPAPGR